MGTLVGYWTRAYDPTVAPHDPKAVAASLVTGFTVVFPGALESPLPELGSVCKRCGAAVGFFCVTELGARTSTHRNRLRTLRTAPNQGA